MSEFREPVWLAVVNEETGEIRIGPRLAAPAGIATVPIAGGTVYIDPTRPAAPPTAVVADPAESAPALEQIFGADAATAVTAGERPDSVPVVATDAAARVVKLGILRWLRSTSPFALDHGLLMLETTVAAAACGDILADDALSPTLEQLGDAIVALAWAAREDGTDALPSGLTDLLEDALNGLVLGLAPDDPLADTARHESELRDGMVALSIDRMDWSHLEELARQSRPEAAVLAGGGDGEMPETGGPARVRGTASVDWARVPLSLLDPGERTVNWIAYPVGGERMRIEMSVRARSKTVGGFRLADWLGRTDHSASAALRALLGGADHSGLRFRLYAPHFGLPLAAGALSQSESGARWQGSAEIPEHALRSGDVFVDVHSEGMPGPRRDRVVATEASRWAARGAGLLRLSLSGPAPTHNARGPLERARQLFAAAADGMRDGDPAASLDWRRAQARCEALLAALLVRAGEPRAAERLRARLAGTDLPPDDTEVPDLGHPQWFPTVTERAVLHGAGNE